MSFVSYMSIFMNRLKSLEIVWFFFLKKLDFSCKYITMENPNCKNENIERISLKIMQKNPTIFEGKK